MAKGYYFMILTAILIYTHQVVTESTGLLRFVDLDNHDIETHHVLYQSSGKIEISRFPFGDTSVYSTYVSKNGYISMGNEPPSTVTNFPIFNNNMIVAPYGANIDISQQGSVRYAYIDDYTYTRDISTFIRVSTIDDYFLADSMIVAEWDHVSRYGDREGLTNTFQVILITDGVSSYAIFIYKCGGMEWGSGVIGWQASSSNYVSHYLSGKADSNKIGCLYSDDHSAIVYRISACDGSSEFTCDDRQCIGSYDVCDDESDCADSSDEEGCALLDDYEIALIVLPICGGLCSILCAVTIYCVIKRRRRSVIPHTVIHTVPDDTISHDCQPVTQVDTSQYQPQQATAFQGGKVEQEHAPAPSPMEYSTSM